MSIDWLCNKGSGHSLCCCAKPRAAYEWMDDLNMTLDPRLLTGTLDLLILDVLSRGESYGYQIAQTVLAQSGDRFELKEGSLYPALHRLERQKWLKPTWRDTAEGRRRKYYKLTPKGQAALDAKREEWSQFASAVNSVLGSSHVVA